MSAFKRASVLTLVLSCEIEGKLSVHKAVGFVWFEHSEKFIYLHSPGALQDPCLVLQPCLQIAEKETEIDRDTQGYIVTVTAVCDILSAGYQLSQ